MAEEGISENQHATNEAQARALAGLRFGDSSSAVFKSSYDTRDFLDPTALQKERDELERALDPLSDWIKRGKSLLALPEEKEEYEQSLQEIIDVNSIIDGLNKDTEEMRRNETNPVRRLWFTTALQYGIQQLILEDFSKLSNLVENSPRKMPVFGKRIEQYKQIVALAQFAYTGPLTKHFDDITLNEMLDEENAVSLHTKYQYLVDTMLLRRSGDFDSAFRSNKNSYSDVYPNTVKNDLNNATFLTWALSEVPVEDLDDYIEKHDGIAKKIAELAREKVLTIARYKQRFNEVLNDPEAEDFTSASHVIQQYLQQDVYAYVVAMHMAGIEREAMFDTYRNALRNISAGHKSEFYEYLSLGIEELASYIPENYGITTKDDIEMLLSDYAKYDNRSDMPTFEELEKIAQAIPQGGITYIIPPENISFAPLPIPESNTIHTEETAGKLTFQFEYDDDTGEKLYPRFFLDLPNHEFDWRILNDPDEEDMLPIKSLFMRLSKSILAKMARDLEHRQVSQNDTRSKTALRKEAHHEAQKQRQEALSPFQKAMENLEVTPNGEKIRYHIVEDEAYRDALNALNQNDQVLVKEKIDEFNRLGGKRMKVLEDTKKDDQPVYSLRISVTTNGGVRVFLVEDKDAASSGTRSFLVQDIDYRKDSYRKKNRSYRS